MAVYGLTFVENAFGIEKDVFYYPEGTSQSATKTGDIVVFDTSDIGIVLATDTTVAGLGILLADATGTDGTMLPVLRFNHGDRFSATISAAGANSAAVHLLASIGKTMSWIKSTETGNTAKTVLDNSDTGANDWFRITALDPRDAAGTSGGRMIVEVLAAVVLASLIA